MPLHYLHSTRTLGALSAHSVFPLTPSYPNSYQRSSGIWIRYFYEGGKLANGDGMLFQVNDCAASKYVQSDTVLSELSHRGVDLSRFVPSILRNGTWTELRGGEEIRGDEVEAEDAAGESAPPLHSCPDGTHWRGRAPSNRRDVRLSPVRPLIAGKPLREEGIGYFLIAGLGEGEVDASPLWHGAKQGAAGILMLGCRPDAASAPGAPGDVPLRAHGGADGGWAEFAAAAPYSATWVGVEWAPGAAAAGPAEAEREGGEAAAAGGVGGFEGGGAGEVLSRFHHPAQAVYLLPLRPDGRLPATARAGCHTVVSVADAASAGDACAALVADRRRKAVA